MNEKKIDCENTVVLTCPHCGDKKQLSWEWTDDGDAKYCDVCEKDYKWEREITITYSSYKIDNS